ncbi:MAG TPA: hypothetical protein VJ908_12315 [Wenzhouxiangellaceae bacterium]|nr:hypothetical protein [Wenzhouxiangellaceae bacterium]
MSNDGKSSDLLEVLPAPERKLVAAIADSANGAYDRAFVELARLRLRNMVEKYSEALKRARLGLRSAPADHRDVTEIEQLEMKLHLCRGALEACNHKLASERACE